VWNIHFRIDTRLLVPPVRAALGMDKLTGLVQSELPRIKPDYIEAKITGADCGALSN
jgi:hypothetical protein